MSCECKICTDIARWKKALVVNEESALVFDEIMDRLEAAEMDNVINRAIIDGDWPSAETQLKHGLENVAIHKARQGHIEDLVRIILGHYRLYDMDKTKELLRRARDSGLDFDELRAIEKSIGLNCTKELGEI